MPNEALITIATRHSVHYEKLKAHESAKFDSFLRQMDKDIRDRLSKLDLTAITRKKLEQQIAAIGKLLSGTLDDYHKVWRDSVKEAAIYEAGFETRALGQVVEGVSFTLPSDSQIAAAVFSAPLAGIKGPDGGALLESFYQNFSRTEIRRIEGAIRAGYAQGQTTSQVVQAIRGTRAGKFADGILATTSRNARVMAHTALQHAAVTAREDVWKANSSVVKKWRFTATLDGKTSSQCRSLDGTEWEVGKGPRLPLHPGERSTTTAVLADKYAFLSEGRTRASRDPKTGKIKYVKANQSYYEWLRGQPKDFQLTVLGEKRTELFRKGGLSAERFAELNLQKNFQPATLEEMRRMEPTAFSKLED